MCDDATGGKYTNLLSWWKYTGGGAVVVDGRKWYEDGGVLAIFLFSRASGSELFGDSGFVHVTPVFTHGFFV
jgi:hypothetical protein